MKYGGIKKKVFPRKWVVPIGKISGQQNPKERDPEWGKAKLWPMPAKQKRCSWSADCTVGSRREEKTHGDCVFQMRYVTCARTVSPLTPAALARDKQSQAICATASCDCLVALGSFPRDTGLVGLPERTISPFSLQLPPHLLCSWSFSGVLQPCSSSWTSFPPPSTHGAAFPALLPGQSGEWAFPLVGPGGSRWDIEQKSLPQQSCWAYNQ